MCLAPLRGQKHAGPPLAPRRPYGRTRQRPWKPEQAYYFDGFDNELVFSSEWVERWLKFVELQHRDREGEDPPSRLCEIETVHINDIGSAEGVLAIIKLFELHWMIRDHQRREFKRAKAKPLPGALYISMVGEWHTAQNFQRGQRPAKSSSSLRPGQTFLQRTN